MTKVVERQRDEEQDMFIQKEWAKKTSKLTRGLHVFTRVPSVNKGAACVHKGAVGG